MREAALLAAGSLEELLDEGANLGGLDVGSLLDSVLREELGAPQAAASPLLPARALWLSAKYANFASKP